MTIPLGVRLTSAIAVLAAAVAFLAGLPPSRLPPPTAPWTPTLPGATARGTLHVHTQRSDGGGTVEDVARAAARAGLDFVIVSDHGDGTREPAPPSYRSGVLCIDAVEISTREGHVLALGLPALPYRLSGSSGDVVEDIHRFGGLAFATHPDSPKAALGWRNWGAPLDGFEWLNADSAWRDEPPARLARTALSYFVRGPESVAALFERPVTTLQRWDSMAVQGRLLVAIAGADAHQRLGWRGDEAGTDVAAEGPAVPLPSYEVMFRTLSTVVHLDAPLGRDAARDAALILDAIGAGRVYSLVDGFARGGALEFFGETSTGLVRMGQRVERGRLRRLVVRARAPVGATLRVLRNGTVFAETSGVHLEVPVENGPAASPGERAVAYRVEGLLPDRGADASPWLVSNPIWEVTAGAPVDARPSPQPTVLDDGHDPAASAATELALTLAASDEAWRLERDPDSTGRLAEEATADGPRALRLDFVLSRRQGARWAAAALELPAGARARLEQDPWIVMRVRATQPLRLSVQLRSASASADLRWTRSLFVGPEPRTLAVPAATLVPVGPSAARAPIATARWLLLVVDDSAMPPGATGSVWVERVALRELPNR